MFFDVLALVGGLVVFVFLVGGGRVLFITRFRQIGYALGFICYVVAHLLADSSATWGFTAAHASFAIAGSVASWRTSQESRQARADPSYAPESAADWAAEGRMRLRSFFARDDLEALDDAIEQFRRSVGATAGHSSYFIHVVLLSTALQARYERLRRLEDLDEIIDIGRKPMRARYGGGPLRGLGLSLLSTALRLRYDNVGAVADLEEARVSAQLATRLVPSSSRHFSRCCNEFAAVYWTQYERTEQARFLDLAIDWTRKSVRPSRLRRTPRSMYLTTLCALLAERGRTTQSLRDLADAVNAGRNALRRVGPDDRLFRQCQNNLAFALRARFELEPRADNLDEAIRLAHRAAESVPPDDPQRADHRLNLALALHLRFRHEQDQAGQRASAEQKLEWALDAARDAANHDLADVPTRIRAGLVWSDIAASAGRYLEAVAAFERVVELLPRLASSELRREDQEDRLGRWTGIATGAAACALAAGQPERALVLLEQGRGILLSRALDIRADLTKLQARNPALAAEFEDLRTSFDTTYDSSPTASDVIEWDEDNDTSGSEQSPAPNDETRRRRRAQIERWDSLLEQIRAEDGFADFAKTPGPEQILAQGAEGPVVYLNVSDHRSDAIIVGPAGLTTWQLQVTPREVVEQAKKLDLALHPRNIIDPGQQEAVRDVLAWLWKDVVEPVLDAAGVAVPASGEEPSRVWWIPTGALALLPIHAAGWHAKDDDPALLGRVMSSYTPTIRALAVARKRPAVRSTPRPLIVAMPETPGAEPLGNAEEEAETVQRFFPGGLLLKNSEATSQRVLDELQDHSWAHFACHAVTDRAIPSRGRLLLHDHERRPLTTVEISRLDLPEPALAYLSSCETARTGARLADEAVHLASAFQVAGFPNVIATLWKVPDRAVHEFTKDAYAAFHRTVRSGAKFDPASAVHDATLKARAKYPNLPGLWAGYVHMGR